MVVIKAQKKIVAICIAAFLLLGNSVFAQQKNFIDRTLDRSYKIIQGDSAHPHKKYFFPIPILSYKPETRWIFGLSITQLFRAKNNDSLTRPSALRLNTSYSQNDQFSVRLMGDVFTNKNKFNITGLIQYTSFIENYWGIGFNAAESAKELYYFHLLKTNVKTTYQVLPNFFAGMQYNFENMFDMRYDRNPSVMRNSDVAGTRGSISSGLGLIFEFDDRNNVFFPTKGQDIELSNCIYTSEFGSQYSFENITLDARKYIGLWKENVLALQLFTNINDGNVPFRMMGTIGSESYMRGYYSGRYRDNNVLAFQSELRKTVWGPLAVVAFGGFGSVSQKPGGLSDHLKPNYGAGLRIMAIPREKMNIRIDYGRGSDGAGAFYLTMGEAF